MNMTYLVLPSSRLAIYQADLNQLRVLPLKAQEYAISRKKSSHVLATSYFKSVSFFDSQSLLKDNKKVQPLSTVLFNKKVDSLIFNQAESYYLSDKFGDIHSINSQWQHKYLNSNLGMPTLLKHFSYKDKNCIVVGDEETRIKVYNEERMHQILSFWFLIRRVPLQLIQTNEDNLVLLTKKQGQVNIQMHEDAQDFVQLFSLKLSELFQPQFSGKMFFKSLQKTQEGECKYQVINNSKFGTLFLLKLYNNKILILQFIISTEQYSHQSTKTVDIQKSEWDYLNSQTCSVGEKQVLVIAYGKSCPLDQKQQPQPEHPQMIKKGDHFHCRVGEDERIVVVNI